jgi:hypothetical protein
MSLVPFGTEEKRSYQVFDDHTAYRLWRYTDAPVFEGENVSLKDVYVDTECGELPWNQIRDGAPGSIGGEPFVRLDAFLEENGDRHDLVQKVIHYLRDCIYFQLYHGQFSTDFHPEFEV